MNGSDLLQMIGAVLNQALLNAPIMILQAASLIGIISVLLVVRGRTALSEPDPYTIGIVLGCAGFFLTVVVEEWIQVPSKPYLRNDLLFLSGFFGGWWNASITIVFSWLGRLYYGGSENGFIALIDIVIIAYSSVMFRMLFNKTDIHNITLAKVFYITTLRFFVSAVTMVVMYAMHLIPIDLMLSLITVRFVGSFSLSIITIYVIILLVRREIARERQFYVDPLSGLPNRRALKQTIEKIFKTGDVSEKRNSIVLVLINISNYPELVQEYSHDWFDKLICRLGKEINSLCERQPYEKYQPTAYVFSDHSFVILLSNIDVDEEQESGIAHCLLTELMLVFNQEQFTLKIRMNVSVIQPDFDEKFLTAWFLQGLSLMEKGAISAVQYFESTIVDQIKLENRLRKSIETWIEEGAVPLWLQPKMQLVEHYCAGAEALLRAIDPDSPTRGISPLLVLSVAEKHQLSLDLEWACVRTVVRQLQQLPPAMAHLKISVNLSSSSLMRAGFGKDLCDLLEKENVLGTRLIVEITETNQLQMSKPVETNIAQLLRQGIGLSLDDFGTGYSSLSLLSFLPISELKLDYSMISNITNPRIYSVITLSADAAKRYSAYVVAEGVETEEQRQLLIDINVKQGQGFLFGRAMPFEDFVMYANKYAESPPEPLTKHSAACFGIEMV